MKTELKVLILGHNSDDIFLLLDVLKKSSLKYVTEIVQTKEEFENALYSFRPDIVLSDYSLPSFDVVTAFKLKQEVCIETPFIVVSDPIGEENAIELIKLGVTDFVLRENIHQVVPKIQRALKEAEDRKQKKLAEHQLRQSDAQLQKIMDLSLDIICTMDEEGKFVTVSAASGIVLCYLPEELVGRKVIDFVFEEDINKTIKAIADLKNGTDLVNLENRYVRKDGEVVTLLWSARWDKNEKLVYAIARDATEIKKAEEKIRNSEKRLKAILHNSVEAYSLLAADGTVIERSDTSQKIFGDNSDETWRSLIHPDDLPPAEETFAKTLNNPGKAFKVEYRFRVPDESYIWLEMTIQNLLEDPAVNAIVLNFRDVTERKTSRIALEESEARLKEAQAIGRIGNWEFNLIDGSTTWSDEIYHIYGIRRGDVQPSFENFISYVHPDERSTVLEKIKRDLLAIEYNLSSFRILRPSGEVRHVSINAKYNFDAHGKPIKLVGVEQDVTEQEFIKEELKKSENQYRELFNQSPIPKWVFDVETLQFLNVNDAAVEHYGYSREEFLSMTLKDIRPKEYVVELEEVVKGLRTDNPGKYNKVTQHVKKNGEVILVEIKSNLIDIPGKQARMVLAIDITERVKYVQAIEEQNAKLREIAWTQSHVVRAPLARMMGLINLLNSIDHQTINTSDVLGYIAASAQELDQIIRDIVRKTEKVNYQPIIEEEVKR
ncbi:PAS domain-containing response regulator [Pontibacter harenae]|uniref:PAS domain-containing response regulator n=1 Tax=Pontibacter harenae TaxID=2894083 RepID=UPI001E41BDD1|nr:PAS domain S-box protein [Pontibacter harenae]MCC9167227.1 PAS domain S-box protein [Pontibacter harenae]